MSLLGLRPSSFSLGESFGDRSSLLLMDVWLHAERLVADDVRHLLTTPVGKRPHSPYVARAILVLLKSRNQIQVVLSAGRAQPLAPTHRHSSIGSTGHSPFEGSPIQGE